MTPDPRIEAVARAIGLQWDAVPESVRCHWRAMAVRFIEAADAVDQLRVKQ